MTNYCCRLGLLLSFFIVTVLGCLAQTYRIGPITHHGEEVAKLFAPELFDGGVFEIHEYTQDGKDVVEVNSRITGAGEWFFGYTEKKQLPTIDFVTLGMTCHGCELENIDSIGWTIVAFDSLNTNFAIDSITRREWGGVDWLEAPNVNEITDENGFIACNQNLRSDTLGLFALPNAITLSFSNIFQPEYKGRAVISWSLEDMPLRFPLDFENDLLFPRDYSEMFQKDGWAGWVYSGITPHPDIEFVGYIGVTGSGIGVLRYAHPDSYYAGEIVDWEHNGEGVWQTRSAFDPGETLLMAHGKWENGSLRHGNFSTYFNGALCASMVGEFFTERELWEMELPEWHAEKMGIHSQGQVYIRWEPMHLRKGVYFSCLMGESTIVPGSEIKVVCE